MGSATANDALVPIARLVCATVLISVPDPLGSVNFGLSGSVITVTDPDPYSFLATLIIKMK
jgi:hypothetical protein